MKPQPGQFTETGVTAATTVTATTFQPGTTDGSNQIAGVVAAAPEASTLAMMAGATFPSGVLAWRGRVAETEHTSIIQVRFHS
jgi:hypothetical protein